MVIVTEVELHQQMLAAFYILSDVIEGSGMLPPPPTVLQYLVPTPERLTDGSWLRGDGEHSFLLAEQNPTQLAQS